MSEVNAHNPPEYEAGTLLWRLKYAYDNPHREFLLIEAGMEIEQLRSDVKDLQKIIQLLKEADDD